MSLWQKRWQHSNFASQGKFVGHWLTVPRGLNPSDKSGWSFSQPLSTTQQSKQMMKMSSSCHMSSLPSLILLHLYHHINCHQWPGAWKSVSITVGAMSSNWISLSLANPSSHRRPNFVYWQHYPRMFPLKPELWQHYWMLPFMPCGAIGSASF